MKLEDHSIIAWLLNNRIKTENGTPLDLNSHLFMYDIFRDFSDKQVGLKAAQIGWSTMAILKVFWTAKKYGIDIIYTLPTQSDINQFAGGKINRLIAQNPILQEWVREKDTVEQKTVGNNIVYFRGCVDEETEVLTEKGWCKWSEVNVGDKLPSLDMENNQVVNDEVIDMTVFDADEEMVHINSRQIDQLVTKDHRCVISKRTFKGPKGKLHIKRAHELIGKRSAHIPSLFNVKEAQPDPFYKILGWVIGDGTYWTKRDKSAFVRKDGTINPKIYETERVCIIQSKFCDELEADLAEAGVKYYKKKKQEGGNKYELSTEDSRRIRQILPEKKLKHNLVMNINQSQRVGLFYGLMMSDGDNFSNTRFFQNKNGSCDAFQALCVLLGKTSSIKDRKDTQNVLIKKTEWCNPFINTVHYKGKAWCPTTRNGTVFIRRNGKVSVTGQTFTSKAAMMVPSDCNVMDELDASDQRVVEQYSTRLQHSNKKWEWYFSHPSAEGVGVAKLWEKSDKKHWFIQCESCGKWQYLNWPESIDTERECYQCVYCKAELSDEARRNGYWIARHENAEYSGYWVPLLICPWVSAKEIIWYYENKSEEYFYNKVLGLPYVGGDNKLAWKHFVKNLTSETLQHDQRIVIGVDTGKKLHYVCANKQGLFYYSEATEYEEIEQLLRRWPQAIAVIDQGGDLIGSRALREKYPGRVFLCTYKESPGSTMQLIKWGAKDEEGHVVADRDRMIQLVVDEFRDERIAVEGSEDDWLTYFGHWQNLTRVIEENERGMIKKKWVRSGDDHFCFVAGTKILTKSGEKNIEDVRVGELVLTRAGFKPVVNTMKRDADVVETNQLTGTGDHPIWTDNRGWVPLDAMNYCDNILICKRKKLHFKVLSIVDTLLQKSENYACTTPQVDQIGSKVQAVSTGTNGNTITVIYQRVLSYIIGIIIRSIITSTTWSAYQEQNISRSTLRSGLLRIKNAIRNIFTRYSLCLMNGVEHQKGRSGILSMLIERLLWSRGHSLALSAESVGKREVETVANTVHNDVPIDTKRENGDGSIQTTKRSTIHNIEVKDAHEYFANGCLVSNCHSTVYARIGLSRMTHGEGQIIGDEQVVEAQQTRESVDDTVIAPNPDDVFAINREDIL